MPEKVNGTKFSVKSNNASLNSNLSPIDSKSAVQLNSTEHKLATLQKMTNNSPYNQRYAHLTSLANNNIQNQPVSQLSKDIHSLPDNVKLGVESLSCISVDDVKVHYNSAKPAQLNAHAYAQGTDINIASGQEKHLPHEAWHVVQQKQGRVRPTTMMKPKVPINDDQGLEKEADVMGARALQMKPFSLLDFKTEKSVQRKGVVQKVWGKKGISTQEAEWAWHAHTQKTENLRARTKGDDQGAKSDAESVVIEEQILAKKARVSKLPLVKLKFNFAGSSEHKWDRGKGTGIHSPSPEGYEKDEHKSGGEKMVKEKEYLGGKKMVFEYAGPVEAVIGGAGEGAFDSGANSSENNLEDSKQIIIKAKAAIPAPSTKKIGEESLPEIEKQMSNVKINIDIKGFSCGGATASTFAAWIKSTYPENFNVNLLLIDPVDGHRISAEMDKEVDVSEVYDEREKVTTGTTLVIPVASNSAVGLFLEPQRIKGAQRIILVYGSKSKHTALYKDGEKKPKHFHWEGKMIKGMDLSKLPKGLYGVNSDSEVLDIEEINKGTWESKYKSLLFGDYVYGEASDVEGRKSAIDKLVMEILERQFLKVETTSV
ncbi:hypothetical protein LBMAG24_24490 [Bacteroidota bacterium]|nr:hypothetical protein LBMAG24_24490 [Bacteroidota bacterium]